jgi:HD-like signal output (HDOD) protein
VSAFLTGDIEGVVLAAGQLPTMPAALAEVTRLVRDPKSNLEDISEPISRDQVLAAKVLRLVNSPAYGLKEPVGTIHRALFLLGYDVIEGIIVTATVFGSASPALLRDWDHALGCAAACRIVAEAAGLDEPESYGVAGLLHDLGKVIWMNQLENLRTSVDWLLTKNALYPREAEKQVLGFDHDTVNAWVAELWHLPPGVAAAMAHHHSPLDAAEEPYFAGVAHLGDFLAHLIPAVAGQGIHVPYLEPRVLEHLHLRPDDLPELLDTLEEALASMPMLQLEQLR